MPSADPGVRFAVGLMARQSAPRGHSVAKASDKRALCRGSKAPVGAIEAPPLRGMRRTSGTAGRETGGST